MSARPSQPMKGGAFAFTADNLAKIPAIIARYPAGRQASAVMPLLDLAQRQLGWVSQEAIEAIAGHLAMAPVRVFEVASFYTMYNLRPVGRHLVQVCRTTPCWLRGADSLTEVCRRKLGIDLLGTSADGLFTLVEVECLGACCNAPVVQIDDDFYEDMSPAALEGILDDLAQGRAPKPGSQTGRQGSAPGSAPESAPGSASAAGLAANGKPAE